MKFKIVNDEQVRTVIAKKESATEIEAGDLVAIDSGYIVKAEATSDAVALAPYGADEGETDVEVTVGKDFVLECQSDVDFAVSHRGTTTDILDTSQLLNLGTDTKAVLLVDITEDAGTVDSKEDVHVRINKPLY